MFAILMNIYGHHNAGQNRLLLDSITENIAEFKNMYGIEFTLMGGCNLAPKSWFDRCPSRYNDYHYNII